MELLLLSCHFYKESLYHEFTQICLEYLSHNNEIYMILTGEKNPNWAMLTKYNWLQLNCTHFTFDSPIKKVKAVFTSICNEMKRIQKRIYIVFLKKNLKSKKTFLPRSQVQKGVFSVTWMQIDDLCPVHVIWIRRPMSKLVLNVKYLLLLSFFKCGQVLQFGAHSRYYKGAL